MEDKNKERLLYKPDIEADRHYESKGTFPEATTPAPSASTATTTPDTHQEIIDDLEELKDMVDFLPDSLHFIGGTLDKLAKRERVVQYEENPPIDCESPTDCTADCSNITNCAINDCDSDCGYPADCNCISDCDESVIPTNCVSYEENPDHPNVTNCGTEHNSVENCSPIDAINCNCDDEEWHPSPIIPYEKGEWADCTPGSAPDQSAENGNKKNLPDINYFPENDPGDIVDLPNLFPGPTKIKVDLVEPRSLVDIAQGNYNEDRINLHEYYIQRLQTVLQHYFQQMITIMQDSGVSDLDALTQDFDGEKVKIPNSNLAHLRDHIIRSQIQRTQKARLMQKTHNVDNTLMHMRAWQASATARARYYSEQYLDSGAFLDSANNELLRKSRSSYDTAYSQSLYDLYKYLNSSVVGINDVLKLTLDEAKAKGKLLKEGVDIYASRKKEIKEARDKQIQEAQAEHDAAVAKAKETKQKDQVGKDITSSSGRNQHEQDLFKDDTGAALTGNVSNGDDSKKDDDTSSSSSDQATDEQYKNDLAYLEAKGYTKEAADAELAKLPQYKDRFGKNDQASDDQYKNDLAYLQSKGYSKEDADKELAKLPQYKDRLGTKEATTNNGASSNNDVSQAAKDAVKKVTEKKSSTSLADAISGIGKQKQQEMLQQAIINAPGAGIGKRIDSNQ